MFKPKKYLGQHFLKNPAVLPFIISAAELAKTDTILEIGPGTGILTEELAKNAGQVYAVEKDFDLIKTLQKNVSAKNVKIVHQDGLFFDPATIGSYKVVANIPYNITSPLIRKFIESQPRADLLVLMVQKEVAERITAKAGDRNRGLLTIIVEFYADAEIVTQVPRGDFYPVPEVDSAVIKITPKEKLPEIEPKQFFAIVKAGFSAKRQQIHNSMAATLRLPKDQVRDILTRSSIDPAKRAEDLTLEDWINLTKTFESTLNGL
jgi:16S rRNA (adenine1518-N6/adenine1519-N6)-dimethyltransferase